MPGRRSHEPSTAFTPTSLKLRREIRDVLFQKIATIEALKGAEEDVATSANFSLGVSSLDPTTIKVDLRYRSPHIGSTVALVHMASSVTELTDVFEALLASLSDGWVWQVS